jgi:Carboxypeptidase regulatory-like domain
MARPLYRPASLFLHFVAAVAVVLNLGMLSAGAARAARAQQTLAQSVAPEDACTVAGKVVRKGNDEAIHFAKVALAPEGDSKNAYHAETDSEGKFVISKVAPGQYRMMVTRNGYVPEAYGSRRSGEQGQPFTLSPGKTMDDLLFRMTPTALITGRVSDEHGEDMPGATVSALYAAYTGGRRTLIPAITAETNDLGEYRLYNLAPGKYLLSVSYEPGRMPMRGIGRAAIINDSQQSIPPVYYPGTTDPSQAAPLDVAAGAELRSMDFTLQAAPLFHIRGRVSGLTTTDPAGPRGAVMLRPGNGKVTSMVMQKSAPINGKDGSFDLEDVPAGSYELVAFSFESSGRRMAHRPVEVRGADVEGMDMAFEPLTTITGHVHWDSPSAKDPELQISLETNAGLFASRSFARIKEDGSFELSDVSAEAYTIFVGGHGPDEYLKSAQYGTADATGAFQTVSGAGPTLELTMGTRGGRVQGRVLNADSIAASGVWVTLVPEDSKLGVRRLFREVKTDASGKYDIRGVAPGSYRLFSWEDIEQREWEDPDFVKAHESQATSVELEEGDAKSVDLTTIRTKMEQGATP